MYPNSKTYCKPTVIKAVWYWHKNRHLDHWKRTESPKINLLMFNQMVFNRSAKPIQWGKNIQQVVLGKLDIHRQKNDVGPLSYTIYKN